MCEDVRRLTAYHEAGHAVAAGMRGGSELRSVTLHATPGAGLTVHRSHGWDHGFIAYAGVWAEARASWPLADLTGCDDDGLTFDDYVAGVLLSQPGDAQTILAASRRMRELFAATGRADELPAEAATEITWQAELEAVWPQIGDLANRLLHGA
jgi:hypothetical protein